MFVVRWNPESATDIAFTVASSRKSVLKRGIGTSVVIDAPCLVMVSVGMGRATFRFGSRVR